MNDLTARAHDRYAVNLASRGSRRLETGGLLGQDSGVAALVEARRPPPVGHATPCHTRMSIFRPCRAGVAAVIAAIRTGAA